MSQTRQLAAIMFTDIVGYTAMMQQNEAKAVAVIKHYNAALEKQVGLFNGQVLNYYGDGSLCIFPSATDAVNCAIAVQHELKNEPVVPLRIGLHIGEIFFEDAKALGDGVNVASRVQSLGQENTILFSAEIHDKIKNNDAFKTVSLGKFNFKNVDNQLEVFALENEGLFVPQRNKIEGKLKPRPTRKRNMMVLAALIAIIIAAFLIFNPPQSKNDTGIIDKSIAVLPFTDMSQEKDQEFLSDGLTEDIITQLAKINSFRVTSRTSVMQYKKTQKPLLQIGKELKAAYILEGSVQSSAGKLRITAQLINAETDEHVWAESYDRSMQDIFSIQTDIAKQIANALKATLSSNEQKGIEKKYTQNTEAYQLYLQGRYQWNKRTRESIKKAVDHFTQALEKDPGYTLAYAGLADSYLLFPSYDIGNSNESYPKARAAAQQALKIDHTLAEAHTTLAAVKYEFDWDFKGAESAFRQALELNPNYPTAHQWFGEFLGIIGRGEESLEQLRIARELDPLSLIIQTEIGAELLFMGRYNEAIKEIQKVIEMDSNFVPAHFNLGWCYLQKKMYPEAIAEFKIAVTLSNGSPFNLSALAIAYARSGNEQAAKKILADFEERNNTEPVNPEFLATIYAELGEKDLVFVNLEEAFKIRSLGMIYLKVNPSYDGEIRSDPRFKDLLRRIGFPE